MKVGPAAGATGSFQVTWNSNLFNMTGMTATATGTASGGTCTVWVQFTS